METFLYLLPKNFFFNACLRAYAISFIEFKKLNTITLVIMWLTVCQTSVHVCRFSWMFPMPSSCALLGLALLHSPPSASPSTWGTWSDCWSISATLWAALYDRTFFREATLFRKTNGGDESDEQDRAICLCVHFIQQTLSDSLIYYRNCARDWLYKDDQSTLLVLKVLRD